MVWYGRGVPTSRDVLTVLWYSRGVPTVLWYGRVYLLGYCTVGVPHVILW